jgi:hypothetical protein
MPNPPDNAFRPQKKSHDYELGRLRRRASRWLVIFAWLQSSADARVTARSRRVHGTASRVLHQPGVGSRLGSTTHKCSTRTLGATTEHRARVRATSQRHRSTYRGSSAGLVAVLTKAASFCRKPHTDHEPVRFMESPLLWHPPGREDSVAGRTEDASETAGNRPKFFLQQTLLVQPLPWRPPFRAASGFGRSVETRSTTGRQPTQSLGEV